MFEIGLLSAFAAGILSFISPCILPLIPVYISFLSKKAVYKNNSNIGLSDRLYLFINSIFFVAGFSIFFIVLGSTATFIGQLLRQYSSIIGRIGGIILIIFGIHYTGLFNIPFLNIGRRFSIPSSLKAGYFSSFIIGIIFSFGWIPCVGLILSGILLLASRLETLMQGVFLLGVYSLGLGIPFILSSIFIGFFSNFLKRINRRMKIVSIISGIFIIILGIIFVTDSMLIIIGYLSSYIPILN